MPRKTETVKVAVEPGQKEIWEEAVHETPEIDSLSSLVRVGVENQISGDAPREDDDDRLERHLKQLIDNQADIQMALTTLKDKVRNLEHEISEDKQLEEIGTALFEALPSESTLKAYWKEAQKMPENWFPHDPPDDAYEKPDAGRIDLLAEALGHDEYEIRRALEYVRKETKRVRTLETDDDTYYYKEI